jgi:hypothetical protein
MQGHGAHKILISLIEDESNLVFLCELGEL